MKTIPVKRAHKSRFGSAVLKPQRHFYMRRALRRAECFIRLRAPEKPHVMVVGGAYGYEAYAFARLGCRVTMIDIGDYTKEVDDANAWIAIFNRFSWRKRDAISFLQADVTAVPSEAFNAKYGKADMVFASRVSHFFDVQKQAAFFHFLAGSTKEDAHVFTYDIAGAAPGHVRPFDRKSLAERTHITSHSRRDQAIYRYTAGERTLFLALAGMVVTRRTPEWVVRWRQRNYAYTDARRPVSEKEKTFLRTMREKIHPNSL
jgi:hypothetical protein